MPYRSGKSSSFSSLGLVLEKKIQFGTLVLPGFSQNPPNRYGLRSAPVEFSMMSWASPRSASSWLKSPGRPNRRCQLVDSRSLPVPAVDQTLRSHMGSHFVNTAANLNVPKIQGIVDDVWVALMCFVMSQGQTEACSSLHALSDTSAADNGTTSVVEGLQACAFDSRSERCKPSFEYFKDLMLCRAVSKGYHARPWWAYFGLPHIPPGGLSPVVTMLPPRVPEMQETGAPPASKGRGVRPPVPPITMPRASDTRLYRQRLLETDL